MLLDKYMEVVVTGHTLEYYRGKGYDVPTYIDKRYNKERVRKGTTIIVKTEDLAPNSHIKIRAKCDNCGRTTTPTFQNYLKSISSGNDGKHYCHKCSTIHNRQTNLEKYGVESIARLDSVKEKKKRTSIERYGTEFPTSSPIVTNKIKETNLRKYGVECVLELPEYQELKKKGSIEKYGSEYPTQSSVYWDEVKRINLEKYGVEWAISSDEVREKINNSFVKNDSMKSSIQQRYINNLYNGKLNYHISKFFVDIFVESDNCCVEYDGGGHNLNVLTGRYTQEEHDKREIVREAIIRRNGHRLIRIISSHDFLPSDTILLQMYSDSLSYFNTTNHTWRNYYIDKGTFKDAEHLDGQLYDFGTLRKIQKSA